MIRLRRFLPKRGTSPQPTLTGESSSPHAQTPNSDNPDRLVGGLDRPLAELEYRRISGLHDSHLTRWYIISPAGLTLSGLLISYGFSSPESNVRIVAGLATGFGWALTLAIAGMIQSVLLASGRQLIELSARLNDTEGLPPDDRLTWEERYFPSQYRMKGFTVMLSTVGLVSLILVCTGIALASYELRYEHRWPLWFAGLVSSIPGWICLVLGLRLGREGIREAKRTDEQILHDPERPMS